MREWYEWKQVNADNWRLCRKDDGSIVAAIGRLEQANIEFENISPDIEVVQMSMEKFEELGWLDK